MAKTPLKQYTSYRSNRKMSGFTLVELVIVIVILGILITLIVISYNNIQQRAVNATVLTQLKQWQKNLQNYASTTGRYPTPNPSLGLTNANTNLPPMCLGLRPDGMYCEAVGGTPAVHGGGSYQGVYEDIIGQDLTNQIAQTTNVARENSPYIYHTSVSLNESIGGIRYGYALFGEAAQDTGVFLYYSHYGVDCPAGDDEVTVQFTLKTPYHSGYGYATNDTAMCRRLIATTLTQ